MIRIDKVPCKFIFIVNMFVYCKYIFIFAVQPLK